MDVLVTHRDKLNALAEKLVAEETVDSEGFEALFSDLPPKGNSPARPRRPSSGRTSPPRAPSRAAQPGRRRTRPDRRAGRSQPTPAPGGPGSSSVSASAAATIVAMTLTIATDSGLEDYPRRPCRRAPRVLPGADPDPEHLGAAGARRGLSPGRRMDRRRPGPGGHGARRGRPRRAATRSSMPTGSTPTAPHRPRLLPLRRPAGRPARPVDVAAVRAGRRRQPDPGPRRGRRQGPAPRPPPGHRGAARNARQAAREPADPVRGRGGVELATTSTPGFGRTASAWPRTRLDQRHGVLRGQHPGDHRRPARPAVHPDRRDRDRGRPPLGQLRRRRREPGQRPGPDHRRAEGRVRADPRPGLLRRRRGADRRGTRGARRAPVRRGRATSLGSASRVCTAKRAIPRWSAAGRGRRSTSTGCGAGSRATAPRRSSRPTPTPR